MSHRRIAAFLRVSLFAGLAQLAVGGAQAQEGLLFYVPNANGNLAAFTINADGTLGPRTDVNLGGATTPAEAAMRGDQAFVYVTLSQAGVNQVALINTLNNTVQTFATGAGPRGVAVSPNGQLVYVANNALGSQTVSVFRANPLTGQLTPHPTVPTIDMGAGSQPRKLAFTPDGSRLIVVNQGNAANGSVSIVDTATNTIVGTPFSAGTVLTGLGLNPAGTRAYATASGQIFVVDTASGGLVQTIANPNDNRGVAFSPDGRRMYVTITNINRIDVFDTSTNTATLIQDDVAIAGSAATGVAVSPDGRFLYVSEGNPANLVQLFSIDPVSGQITAVPAGLFGTGGSPGFAGFCGSGNTLLAAGNTFVANTAGAFGCVSANPTVAGMLALSPGVMGTIALSGNMTFAAGSVLRVDANAAGNADRITLTGRAILNGGTVDVQAVPGTYSKSTSYTILTANGGVSGTFAGATSSLPFLTASLFYDANNVYLGLVRNDTTFASVAQTSNQRAVATYLDTVAGDPGLVALVNNLDTLSATQAREAFTTMNGNGLSAPARVVMAGSANFTDLLAMKVDPASARKVAFAPVQVAQLGATSIGDPKPGENRGVWLRVRGLRGDQEGSDNASGYEFDAIGLAGGFDAAINPDTQLGVAFSYTRTPVTLHGGAGDSLVRSPQAAVYGLRTFGPLQLKGVLGAGWHDIETKRNVTIGGATSIASGEHKGNEWFAYGEANYGVKLRGGSEIRPLAGLRYIWLQEEDYAEQGSTAALVVAERTTESITPLLGVRYLQPFNLERGRFEMRAVWSYEAGDANPSISGRLATAVSGATFTAQGAPISRQALTLGLGIENEVATRLSLYGDYNVELREGQTIHALTGGVRYAW